MPALPVMTALPQAPVLPDDPAATATRLLNFNLQLLDQALALVAAHERPGSPPYADRVGPHLRHVVEHHEALLMPARPGLADYDGRARDRCLERLPAVARLRLRALQHRLHALAGVDLQCPVQVRGLGGTAGEFAFAVASTFGRELAFVASHAVHHYALLRAHCLLNGIAIDEAFGVAPATVAHGRDTAADVTATLAPATALTPAHRDHPATEESSCNALPA